MVPHANSRGRRDRATERCCRSSHSGFGGRVGVFGIALAIALSLVPDAPHIAGDEGGRLGHVIAYATLMAWFGRLLPVGRARLGAAAALCLLGIALEFAQEMTGYRIFDVADMLANASGVCLGWLASPPRAPHGIDRLDRALARRFKRDIRSP